MVFVPTMPSYYTFCINTIGFTITTFSCVFLIQFLNTRPTQHKNILNRILALSVIIHLFGETQNFIMSLIACFFTSNISKLADMYPLITLLFLSSRNIVIAALCSMCCLSAGRLLLFTNPVFFISLNSYTGVLLTGVMSILGITADHLCRWLTCSTDQLKKHMAIKIFKAGIGIQTETSSNHTVTSHQNNNNTQPKDNTDENQCTDIPILKIGAACFLFLEASKLVYTIAKEYYQHRKESKKACAAANSQEIVLSKITPKQKLKRSESLPENFVPVCKNNRRMSLQIIGVSESLVTSTSSVEGPTPKEKPESPRGCKKYLKRIFKQLCVRTSSLFTGFIIFGLIVLINASFSNDASVHLSVTAFVVTERMIMYTLVLLLCVFDKDIVMHFKEKFNVPNL